MRSAVLGVFFVDDSVKRQLFVQASAEITHRDPRAVIAALAVAETAAWMTEAREDIDELWTVLAALSHQQTEWPPLVSRMAEALASGQTVAAFAQQIGATKGVSGYALQSVPVAIYAALRHRQDFAAAVSEAIACGGDTDTVGAITGALAGARVGVAGIPAEWRESMAEYPRTPALLDRVATRLGRQRESPGPLGALRYFWPAIPLRNLVFLLIVLGHGLRRLLPPY
jgi:ADP-ribosylglycohydrolase